MGQPTKELRNSSSMREVSGGGASEPKAAEAEAISGPKRPLKAPIDHIFRDSVDDHFISWKSKKIVEDLRKRHPVKVGLRDFQSADSAMHKLRSMSNAIKAHAEATGVSHHYVSILATDKELSITLAPNDGGRTSGAAVSVKHPSASEWEKIHGRFEHALRKSGVQGTYQRAEKMKMRNVGARDFAVDRFGRRIG